MAAVIKNVKPSECDAYRFWQTIASSTTKIIVDREEMNQKSETMVRRGLQIENKEEMNRKFETIIEVECFASSLWKCSLTLRYLHVFAWYGEYPAGN